MGAQRRFNDYSKIEIIIVLCYAYDEERRKKKAYIISKRTFTSKRSLRFLACLFPSLYHSNRQQPDLAPEPNERHRLSFGNTEAT